jgi:hypothetical protein
MSKVSPSSNGPKEKEESVAVMVADEFEIFPSKSLMVYVPVPLNVKIISYWLVLAAESQTIPAPKTTTSSHCADN